MEVEEEAGAVSASACRGGMCLLAGTPVWLADGSCVPVERVQSGERVLTRDPATGKGGAAAVGTVIVRHAGAVVAVTLWDARTHQSETVTASPEHPFFVRGVGFVPASLLAVGNAIVTRAGPPLAVTAGQRYDHLLSPPAYFGYTFDPQGTLVQRHRQYDPYVVSADTAVYDAFGVLEADADGLTGGAYPGHDSVGYLGQSGHYTDPETQPIAPGGLLSVGGSYYDMKLGRYLTRGGDINGYKALSNNPASYVDWVGVAQTTIDTVGMVPFLNVPCSVVSAGISAARGDWSGMGLSLLAVVPVEGEGDEALKVARDAKSLEKGVADAGEEVTAADGIGSAKAGSIRNINPRYPEEGYNNNCVNCALQTDRMLAGQSWEAARASSPQGINVIEKEFGGQFGGPQTAEEIADHLLQAGNGTRGIIFGNRGAGIVGHVFNVVNQRGIIRFLDGQTGKAAQLEGRGYKSLHLIVTSH